MNDTRIENDLLGEVHVPVDALYGAHTVRALKNFPLSRRPVNPALIHAFGAVKLAAAQTNHGLGWWKDEIAQAIFRACREVMNSALDSEIVVDALQGGAGTSTNMNINEVIANRALVILGHRPGEYGRISPVDDINLHQSTNDTYPTALKVAAIGRLNDLERAVIVLFEEFQRKEKEFAHLVKVGRTQMQDAALITMGREMSAYAEALSRDRWRIYKCVERLRVVNLGGTAVGTGIAAPRQYIFRVVDTLREITGMGLARAENLVEATQNVDVFVEVSGILKACATTLLKISSDLRFMSSGPNAGIGEITLPARQAGSSIMPGKVNPVIPEAVSQAAMKIMANDQVIAHAASMGNLELNPFLPVISDALLESLDLLERSCRIFYEGCVRDMEPNEDVMKRHVENTTAVLTALVELIGYEKTQEIAGIVASEGCTVRSVVVEKGYMTDAEFDLLIRPERVTRLGHPRKRKKDEENT